MREESSPPVSVSTDPLQHGITMWQIDDITCLSRNVLGIMGSKEVNVSGRISSNLVEQMGKVGLWKGLWLTQHQSDLSNRPGPPADS